MSDRERGSDDIALWLRARLRRRLSRGRRLALRRFLSEPLGFVFRRDLRRLAVIYGTDKWGTHWYASHYMRHFGPLRRKRLTLMEIGIGGYEDPAAGGNSLRMWRRYFPKAVIVGLDLHDKRQHREDRIRIYRGDQSEEVVLRRIVEEVGPLDIVIDDGSHQNAHVIRTFEVLFPLLAEDGIYVVEDTQTAYWPEYGGADSGQPGPPTSMDLFKALVDGLNYEERLVSRSAPRYTDRHVTALHFYHNLVFIQKGRNEEGSNVIPTVGRDVPALDDTTRPPR